LAEAELPTSTHMYHMMGIDVIVNMLARICAAFVKTEMKRYLGW